MASEPSKKPRKNKKKDAVLQLKRLRSVLNLSQREIAEEFKVGHAAVSAWESGSRSIPGPVIKLMDIYQKEMGIEFEPSELPTDHPDLQTSWVSRQLKLSSTLALIAARIAGDSVLKVFGSTRKPFSETAAQKMSSTMGELKGLIMKAGQMMGYADFGLKENVREHFLQLQNHSPAVEWSRIKKVLEEELGDFKQRFSEFSKNPLGVGSIGQVHAACLVSGEAVAVKVQYPEVLKLMSADLAYTKFLDLFAPFLFPKQDRVSLVQELRDRAADECDYAREAKMQDFLKACFKNDSSIVIPKVYFEHSSRRVLTQEPIFGKSFNEFVATATQAEKNQAGLTLFRFTFQSAFQHGAVNCDPHPGNYLFLPEQVAFLDFGGTVTLTLPFINRWKRYLSAIAENDRDSADRLIVEMGYVPHPRSFNFKSHYDLMRFVHRPLFDEGPFRFSREFLLQSWNLIFKDNPNRSLLNLPREWVFLNRLQWGMYSVLASLDAEGEFYKIARPLINEVQK
jgi:predicted unusual protein kinase regulating ubiquinone biosynthesis (AarF/ABC1/UbiB family)